jgi:DnaJ-class molecular chaperone
MAQVCALCAGSGDNRSVHKMKVNNHICPRCGGYGKIPCSCENPKDLTEQDMIYIKNNNTCVRRSYGKDLSRS